jgi:hypothetical protein
MREMNIHFETNLKSVPLIIFANRKSEVPVFPVLTDLSINRCFVYYSKGILNLLSTFQFIQFRDEFGRQNLYLLHFNHKTGYIDNYINFKSNLSHAQVTGK